MTEAARRKAVAKPPSRLPVSAPVLWTGLALGTFLAVEALTHGVMLPGLNGFLAAVLTFAMLLAAGVALAELARRHHRTVARHGKRGAIATARHGRRHGGTALRWLVAKTAARWESREHRPLMFRRLRGEPEDPAAETTPDAEAPAPGAAPDPSPPDNSHGGTSTMPASASRIKTQHRAQRAAARSGGSVPSEWGPVIAQTADFEPEDDGELLEWMARQVTGLSAWAEALVDFYEHCTNVVGIDPKASAMLHDVADAAAGAAETMGAAKARFTEHYELPREFAGNGGLMTHDGRWITGEGA
jgi:hypothetical protein